MRFLVDAQLARLLADGGHVAEHVHEIGIGEAPDRRHGLDTRYSSTFNWTSVALTRRWRGFASRMGYQRESGPDRLNC